MPMAGAIVKTEQVTVRTLHAMEDTRAFTLSVAENAHLDAFADGAGRIGEFGEPSSPAALNVPI